MADTIASVLETPFSIDGRDVVISTSIGLALAHPGENHEPDALLRRADLALYRAKADGRARQTLFDPRMEAQAVERMELETSLRQAVNREELRLHYQPIVSLENDRVVGWEALVRWQHPTRGLISPGVFIPVAEHSGLIVRLTEQVIDMVGRDATVLNGRFPRFKFSINLSSADLHTPDTLERLDALGAEPGTLQIEVTERGLLDRGVASGVIRDLRARHISVAIDDFGTGYSSLSYLRTFDADILKAVHEFAFCPYTGRTAVGEVCDVIDYHWPVAAAPAPSPPPRRGR